MSVTGTVRVPSEGPLPTEVSFLDESGRQIGTTRIKITDASRCSTPRPQADPPDIELPTLPTGCGTVVGSFTIDLLRRVLRTRHFNSAWRTTRSTLAGQGLGIAVQLAAGVTAVAVWAAAAWRW